VTYKYMEIHQAHESMRKLLRDLAETLDSTKTEKTLSERDVYVWLNQQANTMELRDLKEPR